MKINIIHIVFLVCISIFISCDNSSEKDPEGGAPVASDTLGVDKNSKKNNTNLSELDLILLKRFNFKKHDKDFVYQNLSSFDSVKSIQDLKVKPLNRNEFFEAFQDTADILYDEKTDGAYYFSNQGNWNGFKRYIFAKKDETCCIWYYYNVYDKTGKKISSEIFAAKGNQSGWKIDVKSQIVNDSTFIQIMVECNSNFEEEFERIVCDSSVVTYTLNKSGQLDNSVNTKIQLNSQKIK